MFSSGWCCSKEKIEDYVLMLRNNSMEKLSIDLFLTKFDFGRFFQQCINIKYNLCTSAIEFLIKS